MSRSIYDYEGGFYSRSDYLCSDSSTFNKEERLRTFMHYTDSQADKVITVFGRKRDDLFYNHDDRLYGDRWSDGLQQGTPAAIAIDRR